MLKILVVDDQKPYRVYVSKRLARDGHQVETACSSTEALERGRDFGPDLLVTDWMLCSGLTGIEVATELRRVLPDLDTVLMSGYPEVEFGAEARQAGIDTIMCKPFSLDDLARLVRESMHP